jgi:hypothetical protein
LASGGDEKEDDVPREARHLSMARQNSLTTVFIYVWEKAKQARGGWHRQ